MIFDGHSIEACAQTSQRGVCVQVRQGERLRRRFSLKAPYILPFSPIASRVRVSFLPQLQQQQQSRRLVAMFAPNSAGGANLYSAFPAGTAPPTANLTSLPLRRLDYSHDVPPLGCNPDAMKLFVGNIPKSYTADSLRPLFEAIGTVVELVVVRDKLTDESKGSAFVWYQTRAEAERAIAELHLRRVLQDPTGEQDRPLVVRRANPKVAPMLLSPSMLPPQQPVYPTMGDADLPAHLQGASLLPQPRSSMDTTAPLSIPNSNPQVNQMQMMQDQFQSFGLNATAPLSARGAPTSETDQLLGGFAAKNPNLNALLEQNNPCALLGQTTAPAPGLP